MRLLRDSVKAGLLALVVTTVFPLAARAEPPNERFWRLRFSLGAADLVNCPDEQYIRTSLAGKLDGYAPFTDDARRSISIDIDPASPDVEARIVARDENDHITANQTLRVSSWRCDLLGERIVFVVRDIVAPLESASVNAQPEPKAPSKSPVASQPEHEVTAPAVAPAKKPSSRSKMLLNVPQLGLSFGGGAGWWNAPETAFSTSFGIEARWKRFSVGIEGQYDHAWSVPNIIDSRAERVGVALVACIPQPITNRFYVRGCGLVDVARLSVQSDNINTPIQYASVVDIGARMGIGAWMLPSSFGVEIRADGAYVAHRPKFHIDGTQVWSMAPFTGALRVAFLGVLDVF